MKKVMSTEWHSRQLQAPIPLRKTENHAETNRTNFVGTTENKVLQQPSEHWIKKKAFSNGRKSLWHLLFHPLPWNTEL